MKIVYSYYVMDLLHTGHILMLKNSKAIAGPEGRLVVGILSDEAVEKLQSQRASKQRGLARVQPGIPARLYKKPRHCESERV